MDLRAIRKEKGLTAASVGLKVGISQQHYSFIETGKRHPSISVAKKLGTVLGFDWTELYKGDGKDD